MALVEKSVLVPYSAQQMFNLVDRVEDYPDFLPWCGGASVSEVDAVTVRATVHIDYHHIKQSFTTENTRTLPHMDSAFPLRIDIVLPLRIDIVLKDGPFRQLDGEWQFIPLSPTACKIAFRLHYEFSSKLLERLVGPVFHYIANNFMDAFIHRAEQVCKKGL